MPFRAPFSDSWSRETEAVREGRRVREKDAAVGGGVADMEASNKSVVGGGSIVVRSCVG